MPELLAYDYPILGIFWTALIVFIWIAWIFLLIRIFADIFRREMSGWYKALWTIFVILLPFLGAFVYLIVNGGSMYARDAQQARQAEAEFQRYVRETAGSGGTADELAKLAELRDSGVISADEFAQQKAKLLA